MLPLIDTGPQPEQERQLEDGVRDGNKNHNSAMSSVVDIMEKKIHEQAAASQPRNSLPAFFSPPSAKRQEDFKGRNQQSPIIPDKG